MKTQIFAYKGHLGATTDQENGIFINDPKSPGQLGVVVPTSEVQISGDAKQLIKNAKREGGSFAPLMLTKHAGEGTGMFGPSSIGLMGFWKHYLGSGPEIKIGIDCDVKVLEDCEEIQIEAPEDFKAFIDSNK